MIVAAIPAKGDTAVKSRLSTRLSPDERRDLAMMLLDRTVHALRESGAIDRIGLASPQSELAVLFHTDLLPDPGSLNGALEGAAQWALKLGAAHLLIVPADLPLISPQAVRSLVGSAHPVAGIVIESTQDGGTGALLLTPPDVIPPAFGAGSFERHLSLARERAVSVVRASIEAFAHDLDTVEDLETFGPLLRGASMSDRTL